MGVSGGCNACMLQATLTTEHADDVSRVRCAWCGAAAGGQRRGGCVQRPAQRRRGADGPELPPGPPGEQPHPLPLVGRGSCPDSGGITLQGMSWCVMPLGPSCTFSCQQRLCWGQVARGGWRPLLLSLGCAMCSSSLGHACSVSIEQYRAGATALILKAFQTPTNPILNSPT